MTYRTKDGAVIEGATMLKLVEELRARAWLPGTDLAAYVRKTAYFAEITRGMPVRSDTAAHLIKDLVAAGLMFRVYQA